jgi:hypothetical protein
VSPCLRALRLSFSIRGRSATKASAAVCAIESASFLARAVRRDACCCRSLEVEIFLRRLFFICRPSPRRVPLIPSFSLSTLET